MNPLKSITSVVDNLAASLASSLYSYDQHAAGMTSSGGIGWNVGSGAGSINYITSLQQTKSGSLMNGDSMLRIAACFDAIRMISEDIAKLPLDIKEPLPTGGTRLANNHPLYHRISVSPDKQILS